MSVRRQSAEGLSTNKHKQREMAIIHEDKEFKLEFLHQCPPVRVEQTCVKFSSDKELIIDPGKTKRLSIGLNIHQKGNYVVHVQPLHHDTSLLMLPAPAKGNWVQTLHWSIIVNFQCPYLHTNSADRVDIVQDLPQGLGLQSIEQQLNNIQSCNFYE